MRQEQVRARYTFRMHRTYLRRLPAFAAAVMCMIFIPLTLIHAQEEKAAPKGSRPATKEDLEWMKWVGLPEIKEGILVNPDDPNIGKAAGEVKKWLNDHAQKGVKIRCLNPQFAQKLKTFMEKVPGGPPVITSGYRSQAEQQAIINRGDGSTRVKTPCGSYHPYGLAADFNQNNASQTAWMRANATQYGFGTLSASFDPNHFQEISGRSGQCGACQADGPDGTLPPSSASPSAGFANAIRQALGLQQQPIQQPPLPPQPLPQTQPINNAFDQPMPIPITPSSDTETNAGSTTSSIADKLEQLAKGGDASATSTQTATSVPLIIDGSDVGGIQSGGAHGTVATTAGIGGSITQSTFTSNDLAWGAEQAPASQGAFAAILASLQASLLKILAYLQPFGGHATNFPPGTTEVYLE